MNEDVSSARTLTPLLRLLHLVSPALPLGAYAYSQGLEYAVHAGWVSDERSAGHWLGGLARGAVGTLDLPVLARLHHAWQRDDLDAVDCWSAQLLAARESAELRAEERHLGRALARILIELGIAEASHWNNDRATWATLFSLAAVRWDIVRARDVERLPLGMERESGTGRDQTRAAGSVCRAADTAHTVRCNTRNRSAGTHDR